MDREGSMNGKGGSMHEEDSMNGPWKGLYMKKTNYEMEGRINGRIYARGRHYEREG